MMLHVSDFNYSVILVCNLRNNSIVAFRCSYDYTKISVTNLFSDNRLGDKLLPQAHQECL
jgi:hypothetical protein